MNENSHFITIQDTPIHYRDEHEESYNVETVILIHGTSSSLHTWDSWTEHLVTNGYRVIRLDLPGFGLTGPNPSNNYTIDHYVDILHDFITQLNIKHYHLAGNSLGGWITWSYAVKYRQESLHHLKSIGLLDAAGFKSKIPYIFSIITLPFINNILSVVTPYVMFVNSVKDVYGDPTKVSDELILRYYELALRTGNRDALFHRLSQTGFYSEEKVMEMLSTVKIPAIIIWGQKDTWIDVSKAKKFNEGIIGSVVKIYPGAGHVPMEEIPKETCKDYTDFISDIDHKK